VWLSTLWAGILLLAGMITIRMLRRSTSDAAAG
jgi:hypothetical protein